MYPSDAISFPANMVDGDSLKVFSERPGYNEGRQFRVDYEFSIDNNDVQVLKFVINDDVDLLLSSVDIDQGGLYYRVFSGGVEGGTFDENINIYRSNNKTGVPTPISQVSASTGGTLDVSGETPNTTIRIRTANNSAQRSTVGGSIDDMRGFPPTTAYIVMTTLDGSNATCTGTLKIEWEQK